MIRIVFPIKNVCDVLGVSSGYELGEPPLVANPFTVDLLIGYGGWSIADIRKLGVAKDRMGSGAKFLLEESWKAEPGYYRVLPRVPNSNNLNWWEQVELLRQFDGGTWEPASIAVVVTALIMLKEVARWSLFGEYLHLQSRCKESLPSDGTHLAAWNNCDYIENYYKSEDREEKLFLAAMQKVSAAT